MFYVKNLPNWERALRVIAGVAAAATGIVVIPGTVGWAVAAGALGFAGSGLVGYCPVCAAFGRQLDKR